MKKIISSAALFSLAMGMALVPAPARAEEAIPTGPEVGSQIPDFQVRDQEGRERTFAELSGPDGLLLLFHRSADW